MSTERGDGGRMISYRTTSHTYDTDGTLGLFTDLYGLWSEDGLVALEMADILENRDLLRRDIHTGYWQVADTLTDAVLRDAYYGVA